MNRIPYDEAINRLAEAYRRWLNEDEAAGKNIIVEWRRFFDQRALVVDGGNDPPDLYLEVEE